MLPLFGGVLHFLWIHWHLCESNESYGPIPWKQCTQACTFADNARESWTPWILVHGWLLGYTSLLWVFWSLSHGKPPQRGDRFSSPQSDFPWTASRGSPSAYFERSWESLYGCAEVYLARPHCHIAVCVWVESLVFCWLCVTWEYCSWYYIYANPRWKLASLICTLRTLVLLLIVGFAFTSPAL